MCGKITENLNKNRKILPQVKLSLNHETDFSYWVTKSYLNLEFRNRYQLGINNKLKQT